MVCTKAGEELAVCDEAAPSLAYEGRTKEAGGVWWEAEKDLDEDIVWQQAYSAREMHQGPVRGHHLPETLGGLVSSSGQ